MTLASLSRYEGDRVSTVGGHAVVLGASMAGIFTARVLADGFERVTVVERDPLNDESVPRRGVPQAHHPHALLEAGRATMEDLFPGYSEDLLSAGGILIDGSRDVKFFMEGDYLAAGPSRMPQYVATRTLFETIARRHLTGIDGVYLRSGCQFVDYVSESDGADVEGVVVQSRDSGREQILSDLVVDATGRTSRTPDWLEKHGYTRPPVDEVEIDVLYSTVTLHRPPGERRAVFVPASHPRRRGGVAFPVENGRWLVNIHGVHGEHPPKDAGDFLDFAAGLPTPELKQILEEHPRASNEIQCYPFPSNRRHHYENLDRFPDGLVVIGDAIASFNPLYGQGMSVAALEALVLHQALAKDGCDDLAQRFFDQAEHVIDVAWMMAVGADLQYPETTGPKPHGTDVFARYLSRLTRKAQSSGRLRDALYRVIMMEEPPTTLLKPRIIARVLKPSTPKIYPESIPAGRVLRKQNPK